MGNLPPLIGILIMGIYKLLLLGWWVYPLSYGNNGSLDPGTYVKLHFRERGNLSHQPGKTNIIDSKVPAGRRYGFIAWRVSRCGFPLPPAKINSSPFKSYRNPIGKDHLPTIIFRGELLNFGGCTHISPFNFLGRWVFQLCIGVAYLRQLSLEL